MARETLPQATDVISEQYGHDRQQSERGGEQPGREAARWLGCWLRSGAPIRGRNEAIPVAGQGLDELGSLSRVSQCLAEFLDGVVQAVIELNKCVRGPQAGAQVFPGNYFSGTFDQAAEHFEGFGRKRDSLAVLVEFPRTYVQLKLAKANSPRRLDRSRHGAVLLFGQSLAQNC